MGRGGEQTTDILLDRNKALLEETQAKKLADAYEAGHRFHSQEGYTHYENEFGSAISYCALCRASIATTVENGEILAPLESFPGDEIQPCRNQIHAKEGENGEDTLTGLLSNAARNGHELGKVQHTERYGAAGCQNCHYSFYITFYDGGVMVRPGDDHNARCGWLEIIDSARSTGATARHQDGRTFDPKLNRFI
jgi:hypothetical protein